MIRSGFLVALSCLALPSFGCPQLAGNYLCLSDDGAQDGLQIEQHTSGGTDQYMINGSPLFADKVERTFEGDQDFQNGTLTVWCEKDALVSQITGDYFSKGKKIGSTNMVIEYRLVGDKVTETTTGLERNDTGDYEISDLVTCTKN